MRRSAPRQWLQMRWHGNIYERPARAVSDLVSCSKADVGDLAVLADVQAFHLPLPC